MAEPKTVADFEKIVRLKRADPHVVASLGAKVRQMSRGQIEEAAKALMETGSAIPASAIDAEHRRQANETAERNRLTNEQKASKLRAFEQMLAKSGLPATHIRKAPSIDPASFTGSADDIDAIMLLLEAGGIVVLLGSFGTGKTQLATVIALRWAKERAGDKLPPAVRYNDTALYISQMRHDCFTRKATSEAEWIGNETRTVGLLILDELDKAAELDKTTTSTFMLERVIKARHDRGDRPTLILANYNAETYQAKVPGSIQSRVKERGDAIAMSGRDWRSVRQA